MTAAVEVEVRVVATVAGRSGVACCFAFLVHDRRLLSRILCCKKWGSESSGDRHVRCRRNTGVRVCGRRETNVQRSMLAREGEGRQGRGSGSCVLSLSISIPQLSTFR